MCHNVPAPVVTPEQPIPGSSAVDTRATAARVALEAENTSTVLVLVRVFVCVSVLAHAPRQGIGETEAARLHLNAATLKSRRGATAATPSSLVSKATHLRRPANEGSRIKHYPLLVLEPPAGRLP